VAKDEKKGMIKKYPKNFHYTLQKNNEEEGGKGERKKPTPRGSLVEAPGGREKKVGAYLHQQNMTEKMA